MSQVGKDAVQFSYRIEEDHRADFQLGHHHQAHENDKRIMQPSWVQKFEQARFSQSLYAGIVAAVVSSSALVLLPRMGASLTVIAGVTGLATAVMVFFLLRFISGRLTESYRRSFVDGVFDQEKLNVRKHAVTIGPDGIEVITRSDTVRLGWQRFLLCVVQEQSLVMVFQGSVYVLPANVLPIPPAAMGERVQDWANEASLKSKAANSG